jgi:hypothetical protein
MRSRPPHRGESGYGSLSPFGRSVWERNLLPGPARASPPGWAFVLAVAAEFRRATAATELYQQLRCTTARGCDDPDAGPARRVYLEFYSDT